ncbi:MAG: hypothetical protein HZB50_18000 [Chloroflexi bacterium]|nr:hypothetical protein [Chloroflexota bacterium]
MKEPITSYILKRLKRGASEDDLIYSVCQKTGSSWEDARARIEQVRNEHLTDIEASQAPLKSLASFIFYIMGIILTIGPIVYLWALLDITRTFLVFVSSGTEADAETALRLFENRCALLSWFELPSIIFTIMVGIGIIIANVRYMSGIWEQIFRKWKAIE